MNNKSKIIAGIVLLISVAGLAYYIYSSNSNSIRPPLGHKPKLGGINIEVRNNLLALFEKEYFVQLNLELEKYQNEFETDISTEYKIANCFDIFYSTDQLYRNKMEKWIKRFPNHFAPHLAIARYYQAKASTSRGAKYAKDTSVKQFREMEEYFIPAIEHINMAIEIEPNLMPAYYLLIKIHYRSSKFNNNDTNKIMQRTLQQFPNSFIIRKIISDRQRPRWGGSYNKMEEVAMEGIKHVADNPNMSILYGLIYNDMASYLVKKKEYKKAEKTYLKAIEYGDHWLIYYHFALLLVKMEKDELAEEYLRKSVDLFPCFSGNYSVMGEIQYKQEKYDNALSNLLLAKELSLPQETGRKLIKWYAQDLARKASELRLNNQIDQAMVLIEYAFQYDSNNAAAYRERAIVLTKQGNVVAGLSDAKTANQLDPGTDYGTEVLEWIQRRM